MIRKIREWMQGLGMWLLLLLLTDILAGVLLWLADVDAFFVLLGVQILGSVILFFTAVFLAVRREKKRKELFLEFIQNPTVELEEKLQSLEGAFRKKEPRDLGEALRGMKEENSRQMAARKDYEEYVESWAHEIKTPLSLMTFLLDNRKEEMPGNLYQRLEYVRSQIQEDVTQMLYYARLKGDTKDYQFEQLSLCGCIDEALEEYNILLREKNFVLRKPNEDIFVFSDRRGLVFMLDQIIGNTVKYMLPEEARAEKAELPRLSFSVSDFETYTELSIQDNGIGVRAYELPFIFEKGFTGNTGEQRKKATGMGLYLVREMAEDLKIELDARSEYGRGFEICLRFPVIEGKHF